MGDRASAPDAELVQSIQDGIESAWAGLFEKYSSRVFYLALRELRSHADAEDVRAETFLRVFQAIRNQQVRTPDSLSSFILGTARNIILETLRSPHRAANEREVPDVPSPELDPALDEDVRHAIAVTIQRLKPKEREFLRLYYYEDLPKQEIARRIGIDEERVRLLKHRCLKSFREIYQRLKKISDTKVRKPSL
jgi:RNA polymerase sigma-70 factor (ECF subfamily)